MKTQSEMILAHLKRGKKLTALGAIDQFGVTKLATRISELIDQGYAINKRWIEVKDRFGVERKVMQYSM